MTKILAIILEGKGGCGKSFIAQLVREWMMGPEGDRSVRVLDSDINNSSMAQIDPSAKFAGLRDENDIEARGIITMAVRDLGDSVIDGVVWDTAAGIEDIIRSRVLPAILVRAAKAKVAIVVLRPITTSQFTQDAALEFAAWAAKNGVGTVFVRNLGQGRAAKYFSDWDAFEPRRAAIPPATEVVLPDLGCWVADEATSLGLGLGDVALGRFGRLTEKARAVAERKFTPEIQLAVADWLELRRTEFDVAIKQAIANMSAPPAPTKTKADIK